MFKGFCALLFSTYNIIQTQSYTVRKYQHDSFREAHSVNQWHRILVLVMLMVWLCLWEKVMDVFNCYDMRERESVFLCPCRSVLRLTLPSSSLTDEVTALDICREIWLAVWRVRCQDTWRLFLCVMTADGFIIVFSTMCDTTETDNTTHTDPWSPPQSLSPLLSSSRLVSSRFISSRDELILSVRLCCVKSEMIRDVVRNKLSFLAAGV